MVGDNQFRALGINNVIVRPKPCRWVVVNVDAFARSDLQLPVNVIRNAVRLVYEQVVTFSVLCVLRVVIRFELQHGVINARYK